MRALLKSDMFRNFMGGFVLGTIALFSFQPASGHSSASTPSAESAPASGDAAR